MNRIFKLLCLLVFMMPSALLAQNQTVAVPDLTGLSVPRAAAELNRVGLLLGNQTDESRTDGQNVSEGGINNQSIAAGTTVEAGSAVDVTVLRSPNLRLMYDDNDLTIINLTEKTVDLTGLVFNTVDGNPASYVAAQLADNLPGTQCVQIWSVSRNGPKELAECSFIENWTSTTNSGTHFWITATGATSFNVMQDDAVRTTCNTADAGSQDQPLTCDFYLPSGGQGGDVAEYVYFTYTTDYFVIVNTAPDEWMRLNRAIIHNANPNNQLLGASFKPGDPELFGNAAIVADVRRLAPEQCLLFKGADVISDTLPQPCNVIAQLDLPSDQLFWISPFELESRSGKRYTCPAAVEGKQTICAMPR